MTDASYHPADGVRPGFYADPEIIHASSMVDDARTVVEQQPDSPQKQDALETAVDVLKGVQTKYWDRQPPGTWDTAYDAAGLVRVYVAGDGRHHWSRDRALTLCGMVTSTADVVKAGDVQCSACRELVEAQP